MGKRVIAAVLVLFVVFMVSGSIAWAESNERQINSLDGKIVELQRRQQQLMASGAPQSEIDTISMQIEGVRYQVRAAEGATSGGKKKVKQAQVRKTNQQQTKALDRATKIENQKNAIGKAEVELDQVNGQIAALKKKGGSKSGLNALEAKAKKLKDNLSALKKELAGF